MDERCHVCDVVLGCQYYYLPMYEGEVVPYDLDEEWFGAPVCEECFNRHEILENLWKGV